MPQEELSSNNLSPASGNSISSNIRSNTRRTSTGTIDNINEARPTAATAPTPLNSIFNAGSTS